MATLTTPIYGFPYPDGAERVMDGDNAIGALAAAVEGVIATTKGVSVLGAASIGVVATEVKLPLDSVSSGNAAWLDAAGDRLIVPAGLGGLYIVNANISVLNTASWARGRFFVNNIGQNIGTSVRGAGGNQMWSTATALLSLNAGDLLDFRGSADAADAADITMVLLTVARHGVSLG